MKAVKKEDLVQGQKYYMELTFERDFGKGDYPLHFKTDDGCVISLRNDMSAIRIGNPCLFTPEEPFKERVMMVSDNNIKWYKEKVYFTYKNQYFVKGTECYVSYKYAKEIEEETISLPKSIIEELSKSHEELKKYLKWQNTY